MFTPPDGTWGPLLGVGFLMAAKPNEVRAPELSEGSGGMTAEHGSANLTTRLESGIFSAERTGQTPHC